MVAPAPFGGLESVLRSLASGHTRRGHVVRVAVVVPPEDTRHPFADALESDGVATRRVRVGDRDYGGERRAIRDLCRAERTDVVHTHGFRPDVVDGSVARGEGISVVSTCHGFIDSGLRGRFYQWLQRRALRHFDAVIAVSSPIAERVQKAGVPAQRIHLLPNVFASTARVVPREEARRRLGLPETVVIGWVGRLSAEKGPDLALEAFARLPRRDARLVMIGGGPDEAALRRRAAALAIDERVIWTGVVPDAGGLFTGLDVFLLSSRTEGTPITLLEAVAAAVPDAINESSGVLVESGDVAGMAAALADVLDKPELARARAERARARLVGGTAADEWLSRYESIYRSVLR